MSSMIHVVVGNLLQDKDVDDICCLCYKKTNEDHFQIGDEVTIEIGKKIVVETLSTILDTVLSQDVSETMAYFNVLCKECMDAAIISYRFIKMTKNHSEAFLETVNSLINGLYSTPELYDPKYNSLYVHVKKDFEIEQIYDEEKQIGPKTTILQRFQAIVNKTPPVNLKVKRKRRVRDHSTIFIKTHELIHDPSKPKVYRCKVCLKLYPNSGSLRQHFFASHFKKEYQCPMCPKGFGTEGLLKTHINQSHFSVDCAECGKSFCNRMSTLKRHYESHARELKTCPRCGRTYKKKTDYERHVAQESCTNPSKQPGDYRCEHCQYRCHFKHMLNQHIKYEHTDAEAHICQWCDRKCYSLSALRTHVLKHTKEKNFVCNQCGGRFVTRQSLVNHMRLHTGERPYQCEYCDQSFLSASRRKEHIERKHVDIVYECNICDARYNAKRSLTKHRKKHHMQDICETEIVIS